MDAYTCPSCSSNDPNRYLRCNLGSCPDGRDPRPVSGIAALRAELEAVKAERDRQSFEIASLIIRAAQLSEGFRSAICDLKSQGFDVSDLQKLWDKNQG